jgi:acetyl esterase/lipase
MKTSIILSVLTFMAFSSFAQMQPPIPLYTHGVPNSKPTPPTYKEYYGSDSFLFKVSIPTITPYFPDKDKANGTAVIICPGGGYAGLSMDNEGWSIAKAFNKIGVTAFVLKYRLPSDSIMIDPTIGPLQDAQRAVQMIRKQAAELGIDPNRIGIIGFSAGGHLASTAITHFDRVVIANADNISVRPDFGILLYPVITMGPKTHTGSKENLIGKNASPELMDLYSNEKQVTANTPPTFLVQAEDDDVVPVENSLLFYHALLKNKVQAEMHLYPAGGHGFGLHNRTTKDEWFDRLTEWMDANGWLKK